MAGIKALLLVVALATAPPASAETVAAWRPFAVEASIRFGVPVAWIERVMQAESAGRTMLNGRPIVSRAGAMGLMQLMPATWSDMRATLLLGNDPFDPHDNIIAGTAYLRLMYDRFGYPGMFAAYNAGPGRYDDYLAGRRPLPGETAAYLGKVSGRGSARKIRGARPPSGIFVVLATGPRPSGVGPGTPPPGLFALPPPDSAAR